MHKRSGTQLNCFSPPVMLATLTIEFGLAIYTLWRYKLTNLTRIIVALLVALASFQVAEYFVCTGNTHAEQWSRMGFVAITALPPLGLHLMHVMADRSDRRIVYTAYATMLGFIAFFLGSGSAFAGHQCTGNYVIFQFSSHVTGAYAVYYYGWILAGIGLGMHWANHLNRQGKKAIKRLESVRALILGYFVFLVPTAIANTIRPETRRGIPSIMCGFAVILAFILVLYILPRMATKKSSSQAVT